MGKKKKMSDNEHRNPYRHPPHLRGKAIGMFYAQLSKKKRLKPLGTVLLSESKRSQIKELLKNTISIYNTNGDGYNEFQMKFFNMITGSIQEKLETSTPILANETLDLNLYDEFNIQKSREDYKIMHSKRCTLPSYIKKKEILELISKNQVVVVSGETGCGKTTQVAQFILDDFVEKRQGSLCNIICTQPRRISAISVAERVAVERAEPLGQSVGYHIRLEKELPRDRGCIVFCTTGVVLRQMETNPSLSNISHIILDEIHERDIMCDFLMALLKQVITKRKDLKIILMSATLNSEKFSSYFDDCPHINIPGFTYPVEEYYMEDVLQRTGFKFDDYAKARKWQNKKDDSYREFIEPYVRKLERDRTYTRNVCIELRNPKVDEINIDLILALIADICEKEKDKGAILVFLPGLSDISNLHSAIEKSGKFSTSEYLVIPLHSLMPTVSQKQVFDRPPNGVRKIVLATNIAETSITIDDIVFVIDGGRIKMKNYDSESNTQTLKSEWVSLANATQRKGRSGRVQAGVCYHLFSRARNMTLEKYQKPEILRSRLENTILTIKLLQLGMVETFLASLIDSPKPEVVRVSINLLKRLNALDETETLTPLGYHLARLPMGPQIGKMILMGAIFSCLDPVLSIAASLDYKDAFQIPLGKEKEVDAKKQELSGNNKSDHILLHIVLKKFENMNYHQSKQFCWKYFLHYHTLNQLQSMKKQFMEYLYEMKFVNSKDPNHPSFNVNSNNLSLVKAVICSGLYPNVGIIRNKRRVNTIDGKRAEMHMKSLLHKEVCFESPLFVYYLKILSSSNFIHDATMVHPLPLIFFGDNYEYSENEFGTFISIGDEKLKFKCSNNSNLLIKELKDRLNKLFEYKINNPGFVDWNSEGPEVALLRAVMELITSEDIGDIDLEAYDDD